MSRKISHFFKVKSENVESFDGEASQMVQSQPNITQIEDNIKIEPNQSFTIELSSNTITTQLRQKKCGKSRSNKHKFKASVPKMRQKN